MKWTTPLPSQEVLFSYLDYHALTGVVHWKTGRRFNKIAGCKPNTGHLRILIGGHSFGIHRVIWKMMMGREPYFEIDHIDGDGSNNKWTNLREATSTENNRNRSLSRRNKSGIKGICWESSRRKWRATIGSANNNGLLWIGRFDDLAEATTAIEQKRRELHGDFARSI